MNNSTDIILLGATLSEGQSLRTICPACKGGTSEERTLSITRNEGLVWQCYRATCGAKGATHSATSSKEKTTKKEHPTWEGTTHELPPKVRDRIETLWGITNPLHWYWTTDFGGRVAMSVRSPSDTHRGWILRALSGTQRTKVLNFINPDEEGLSWYKTKPYAVTVIVEDIPSALRASTYVNSVALLGTGVGSDRALEIAQHSTTSLVVALDQDATDTAFRIARKWSLLWGDVSVLPLTKDIKNMNEEELKDLLNEREACIIQRHTI